MIYDILKKCDAFSVNYIDNSISRQLKKEKERMKKI